LTKETVLPDKRLNEIGIDDCLFFDFVAGLVVVDPTPFIASMQVFELRRLEVGLSTKVEISSTESAFFFSDWGWWCGVEGGGLEDIESHHVC
jgi:hypothetical protein